MPVAIETVIIIIVVISFAVLGAVVFALYWLWRLLLEDRRCSRLSCPPHDWQRHSVGPAEECAQRALLTPRGPNPRISRRREVYVDERSRRMMKNSRCPQCPVIAAPVVVLPPEEPRPPDVVVLDGTVPPPPYEDSLN